MNYCHGEYIGNWGGHLGLHGRKSCPFTSTSPLPKDGVTRGSITMVRRVGRGGFDFPFVSFTTSFLKICLFSWEVSGVGCLRTGETGRRFSHEVATPCRPRLGRYPSSFSHIPRQSRVHGRVRPPHFYCSGWTHL